MLMKRPTLDEYYIEIAKAVEEGEQEYYLSAALNILQAMEKNWCDWTEAEDSILQMGSER